MYEPLAVAPAIAVELAARPGIVPLGSKSFPLSITIHSNAKGAASGSVELQLPNNWKSDPASQAFQTSKDGGDQSINFPVLPGGLTEKQY